MIDEQEEQLEDKETELALLKNELAELDKKGNTPGQEGAEIRQRVNELVIKISKLESEVQKRNEEMRIELHKPEPSTRQMEGRSKIF